ncbi:THUMP domain-containing class I SAM-dependent RNA methyltransferase [Shimia sediminis]|uniref:THUMP domain-containing class I SAM-dependent RNA methyltransferase n=1 Tax=Shimia sediminis TaxID=2497945 RepID=UPI000F8E2055|nr:class I SAM-dependent RNA methyltransferase [Shimia sediminis]
MRRKNTFEIFVATAPGLEPALGREVREKGFERSSNLAGGVSFRGDWNDVWRANLELRGATRVLARIGAFRAMHLSQLDKRARTFPWGDILRPDVSVRVEVSSRKSKIYHQGAAAERIEKAISEELGAPTGPDGEITLKVRIEDNLCTFSIDTSGESLHKRGHKIYTGKAPIRETLAALLLRQCRFDGSEPLVDPMCGSGTFVIEAAELAAGLQPGRDRTFAFQKLANFDADAFQAMRRSEPTHEPEHLFFGFDRDAGSVRGATKNAERAGVEKHTAFSEQALSHLETPSGAPGLVMVNPPYGARIGDRKSLFSLYGTLGKMLKSRFPGWRVGIVTSDGGLAKATGLAFIETGPPIANGGLRVKLYQTGPI